MKRWCCAKGFLMLRRLSMIFTIIFAAQMPVGYSVAQGTNRAVGFEDQQQLSNLISQFSYAWDAKDTDALLALFTPDCIWQEYRNAGTKLVADYKGRAELDRSIRPQLEGYKKVGAQSRHFQSNAIVTFTGENTAEATNMAMITWERLGRNEPQFSETGIYKTSFVKTSDGWKMAKRTFYSDAH